MWYVIQTISGEEQKIMMLLQDMQGNETLPYFVPVYEEVLRSGGKSRISFKKLFPGYIFIETDKPEEVSRYLRKIPDFSRLLGTKEDDNLFSFVPVEANDEAFLKDLFADGIMHVSYVQLSKTNRIERVVGPLARYRNHITKLEIRHRMAIVEAEVFGKTRKIKFGLWTDGDPELPWLSDRINGKEPETLSENWEHIGPEINIGIRVGDRVVDESGIYGDTEFVVEKVDPVHRRIYTSLNFGIAKARVELAADWVRVV